MYMCISDIYIFMYIYIYRCVVFSISAAPSIVTQPLATATNPPQQTQIVNSMTNTPVVTTVPNKSNKSPGQDRLVCSLCNKVYRSSAGLRYHKRKRHRGKIINLKFNRQPFEHGHAVL